MKLIFQSIIIVYAILALFSTGCIKNDSKEPLPAISDNEPANLQNPYDDFGYWHNVILDSVEQQRKAGGCIGFASTCNYIRKFYRMKNWPELPEQHLNPIPQVVTEAATDIHRFINASRWSDSAKAKLILLIKVITDASTDSCTYPKLKKAIKSFEQDVLRSDMRGADKEAILKAASIARYSGYRWIQQPELTGWYDGNALLEYNNSNGFKTSMAVAKEASPQRLFERVGKWIAVTAIDISGAITDLSVASGAAASDFMKEVFKMH
ncbi:hypothetical protein [Niabella aquatica]